MWSLVIVCMLCVATCFGTADDSEVKAAASALACATLRATLPSPIVERSGSEYNATAQGTWSLFNAQDHPTCIVYPRTASHVQTAMKVIYQTKSHYAVQAGAHSAMVGWNSITNGVLIAFSHMTNVTYNTGKDTITVQPGVHWGAAMDAVEPFGVSVVGGRASDVGTGLLLGGGISFLSPAYGFAADSIKEMDVVLVTGELVTVNATNQYADLFRALKGGANRFGIVTRYELYPAHTGTKEEKNWYGGSIVYPGSSSEALSNASARFVREVNDSKASLIVLLNTMDLEATDANIIYAFYNGPSLPSSIFGDFLAIPYTSASLAPLSYYDISNLIAPGSARGFGQQFGASSFVGDETLFLDGYRHLINFTTTFMPDLLASYLIISPVPRSQFAASQARGGNAIGDPGVAYAAMNFEPIYPAGVTAIPGPVKDGFKLLLEQVPRSPGLPLFMNECDPGQDVYKTYPAFSSLKRTYAKYDPLRFNVKHTDGPIGL